MGLGEARVEGRGRRVKRMEERVKTAGQTLQHRAQRRGWAACRNLGPAAAAAMVSTVPKQSSGAAYAGEP